MKVEVSAISILKTQDSGPNDRHFNFWVEFLDQIHAGCQKFIQMLMEIYPYLESLRMESIFRSFTTNWKIRQRLQMGYPSKNVIGRFSGKHILKKLIIIIT